MNILPISIDDLIHAKSVESARREFKKTWNPPIRDAVIRTICAFANDFQNLSGGYIILGIEEQGGSPLLPPHGLEGLDLGQVQREIRGQCNRIDPQYQPVMSPELFQGRQILVLWVPGGEVRPYSAPEIGDKGAARLLRPLGQRDGAGQGRDPHPTHATHVPRPLRRPPPPRRAPDGHSGGPGPQIPGGYPQRAGCARRHLVAGRPAAGHAAAAEEQRNGSPAQRGPPVLHRQPGGLLSRRGSKSCNSATTRAAT